MTLRGVILGLLLGLGISFATFFNDWVIGQTPLIGNHLPISVFGFAVVLLFAVNPLLGRLGPRAALKAGEVAVVVAIGLAACGWPGSNFYRAFATVTALPSHWLKTKTAWQSTNVFSYVPGASAELGQGHVKNWEKLPRELTAQAQAPTPLGQLFRVMNTGSQRTFEEAAKKPKLDVAQLPNLTRALNQGLAEPALFDPKIFKAELPEALRQVAQVAPEKRAREDVLALNRAALVAALPEYFVAPPEGNGALLLGGKADPFAVDTLLQGRGANAQLSLSALPWKAWAPTLWLWGGLAMAFAFASLCLTLIVHPQWSKRELLAYPVARFIEEASERKPGNLLPEVAQSKLFWGGAVVLFLWHFQNGLHAWFPAVPEIPRGFDLTALAVLFPNAAKVDGSWGYFAPTLYISVIAFSFFMPSQVSFSLGVAQLLFIALGAVMLGQGYPLDGHILDAKNSNLLRVGGFLGMAGVILYTGRSFYKQVVLGAFGKAQSEEVPSYSIWAARVLVVFLLFALYLLHGAGLTFLLSCLFVLLTLLLFLVMTRIATETGAFFIQPYWAPVGVITAVFGFESVGPTAFALLAMASVILTMDPREALMPYLAHALRLVDRTAQTSPAKAVPWLTLMILSGFVVAGTVTFYLQYNRGAAPVNGGWQIQYMPAMGFDLMAQHLSDSIAKGSLAEATQSQGLARLLMARPLEGGMFWMGLGLFLVLLTALGRLRLPSWPLHPVLFLVWGSTPLVHFGASFLIGWMVKSGVISTTGAKGYRSVRPLMIGLIAGELMAGLFWILVGATYYFTTGKTPVAYSIFPG
ncbi:MAG: DUF6785 family protein [Polyangiaceae bacterium]|nr:DUF6785 family protein [Polyangiaceae bacterium]